MDDAPAGTSLGRSVLISPLDYKDEETENQTDLKSAQRQTCSKQPVETGLGLRAVWLPRPKPRLHP